MNWLRDLLYSWLNKRIKLPKNTKPAMPDIPKPKQPKQPKQDKPAVFSDDPSCELVIKCGGRELRNEGQVIYIKRFVTAKMFDGNSCVCVQYNDASCVDGERTVFKDTSRTGEWSGQLPTDIPISKLVLWYA
jgi:hypothetical protein